MSGASGGFSGTEEFVAALGELLPAMERHEVRTFGHSYAVAAWSRRLAMALGLAAERIDFTERCGLLHDVGKLRIPATILLKPGQLSPVEWTRMKEHPAEGAAILRAIPALAQYSGVAETHHERIDGFGYPNRLSAAEIPLESRIVCVADAFDAMISVRTYQAPRSVADAIAELRRFRGRQFDSDIVECLVGLVERRNTGERSFGIG